MTSNCFKAVLVGICTLYSIATGADNRYDWMRPGENVCGDYIIIEISLDKHPLQIERESNLIRTSCASLNEMLTRHNAIEVEKTFRMETPPNNPESPDLSRFYNVHFSDDVDIRTVLVDFNHCDGIELAEPAPLRRVAFVPNDPRYDSQWFLPHCGFPDAWEISQGSEEIVIGLVDTGIDMPDPFTIHEDLAANIWVNPGEDVDGDDEITMDDWNRRDDDDNGYIDDFFGWDIVGNDNLPDEIDDNLHGTFMAGLISGVTDNETGIASAGFSCRIMIAGCASRDYPGSVDQHWVGIEYCAANGADVINLSFGVFSPGFEVERRAIDYALEQGCIVFAAAGNNGVCDRNEDQEHYYPAAYDGVIGVGATDQNDERAEFNRLESSNWGDYVDICAPGTNHMSTVPRSDYLSTHGGTSGSSAITSGLAALMLSIMPDLTTDEMLARMRQTAVDVSDLNQDFPGITHRINAGYLLGSIYPLLEITGLELDDYDGDQDGRPEREEHVRLLATIANREGFTDAGRVQFTLATDDPYIHVQRAEGAFDRLAAGEEYTLNEQEAPMFYVQPNAPRHYTAFTLTLEPEGAPVRVIEIPMIIRQPYYLQVDDDDGGNFDTYYRNDLDELELVYDTWSIAEDGLPESGWLNDFSFVVWETGNARQPLPVEEQNLLAAYLDDGGALLLSGQYVGDDHGDDQFFGEYLHARHLDDTTGDYELNGVAEHPITNGMSLLLIGAANNCESPSSMEPLDGAEAIFTYNDDGQAGGIYWSDGSCQVIYLGFPLEAASGLGETTSRVQFIDRALTHFYTVDVKDAVAAPAPKSYSLSQPYPNPFNAVTAFSYSVPDIGVVSLDIYDLRGCLITNLADGEHQHGNYTVNWDASGLPAGLYFARLSASGCSFTRKIALVR